MSYFIPSPQFSEIFLAYREFGTTFPAHTLTPPIKLGSPKWTATAMADAILLLIIIVVVMNPEVIHEVPAVVRRYYEMIKELVKR
jgi:hypothetical protein